MIAHDPRAVIAAAIREEWQRMRDLMHKRVEARQSWHGVYPCLANLLERLPASLNREVVVEVWGAMARAGEFS